MFSPFPNGWVILVLMIQGNEDEVQKQMALKVCWGFAFAFKNEKRGSIFWNELKVKVIMRRGVNANPTLKKGVGEKK